jgi:hypothetical protein
MVDDLYPIRLKDESEAEKQQLSGTFNRIDGPCPLCRKAEFVRLRIPSGQVECEKCASQFLSVTAYVAKVEEAFGHDAYQRTTAAIVASAAASGLLS